MAIGGVVEQNVYCNCYNYCSTNKYKFVLFGKSLIGDINVLSITASLA